MTVKLYNSAMWLRRRFITERKSVSEMATEAGVAEMTIRRALEREGLIKK